MGQYWLLFNLDKSKFAECGGAKFGKIFYGTSEIFMLNLLLSGQPKHDVWGGDRVILLGDYSRALPPNTVTDDDSALLKKCARTDNPDLCAFHKLSFHSSERETLTNTSSLLPAGTVFVLRSHSKKEYVRRDTVVDYRKYPIIAPALPQVLLTLVGWSEDPSTSLEYSDEEYVPASGGTTVPLHRGAWAGDRIDIVALGDGVQKTLDEQGWTDISEEKARHVSDIYACANF